MTPMEQWAETERRYKVKAVELCKGQHPAYNIDPVLTLVRLADRLGFDVVTRPTETVDAAQEGKP